MITLTDSDPEFRSRVSEHLAGGSERLALVELADLERLVEANGGAPAVLLLGPTVPAGDALRLAERMHRNAPEASVVLVAENPGADFMQQAMRAGVRDVLPESFTPEQLSEAIDRATSWAANGSHAGNGADSTQSQEEHRVVTVFSAKGGVGKSFVAANLAVLLAERNPGSVALVDLDLQFGDQAIMLQVFPARTIADAAGALDRLDEDALGGYLTPHRSSVRLLAAPVEPGLADSISAAATQRILRMLRKSFSFVIIDTPALFTEHVLTALDESDECVFLTSLDVPSIKNTKLALQTLEVLGVGRDRIRLALNRADSQVGLRVQEVERTLGATVNSSIPSSREVPLSINQGRPLVSGGDDRSPVCAALRSLASSIARSVPVTAGASKSRFRLRRRVG